MSLAFFSLFSYGQNEVSRENSSDLLSQSVLMNHPISIQAPDGTTIPARIRTITPAEALLLLKSDDSGNSARNMQRYWRQNPQAYYRWDPVLEMGLITDVARHIGQTLAEMETPPSELKNLDVVTIIYQGQERIVGFGSYGGDPTFHADSEFRRMGYKGIGTAIIVAYLRNCLENGITPDITSVNNTYKFYENLGFEYSDETTIPSNIMDAERARFDMHIPYDKIPRVLSNILRRYSARYTSNFLSCAQILE